MFRLAIENYDFEFIRFTCCFVGDEPPDFEV
jgi:hypothetical protein